MAGKPECHPAVWPPLHTQGQNGDTLARKWPGPFLQGQSALSYSQLGVEAPVTWRAWVLSAGIRVLSFPSDTVPNPLHTEKLPRTQPHPESLVASTTVGLAVSGGARQCLPSDAPVSLQVC